MGSPNRRDHDSNSYRYRIPTGIFHTFSHYDWYRYGCCTALTWILVDFKRCQAPDVNQVWCIINSFW